MWQTQGAGLGTVAKRKVLWNTLSQHDMRRRLGDVRYALNAPIPSDFN